MTKYQAISIYTAQLMLVVYMIIYLIPAQFETMLAIFIGTIAVALFTLVIERLYKRAINKFKKNLVDNEFDSSKFMFFEKLNLYSKAYGLAVIISFPIIVITKIMVLGGVVMVLTFVGLLTFSHFGLKKYINNRYIKINTEMENIKYKNE